VPGIPPSLTCSVHSDPDQYRFSCRAVGSISQPGAMPVNAPGPEDAPKPGGACSVAPVAGVSVSERERAAVRAPPRRRCEDNIRSANRATKMIRAIVEPWP
jgi:hypothetical protein